MRNRHTRTGLAAAVLLSGLAAPAHAADIDATALRTLGQSIIRGETQIAPGELNDLIVKQRGDFTLIDVRPAGEFEAGHIKAAANLPLPKLFDEEELERLRRAPNVIVYSNATDHAAQAAVLLRLAGVQALSLRGGFDAWATESLGAGENGEDLSEERRAAIVRALNNCPALPEATIPPLMPAAAAPSPAPAASDAPTVAPVPGMGGRSGAPRVIEPGSSGPARKPNVPIILEGACG